MGNRRALASREDRLLHVPQALEQAVAIRSRESLEQAEEEILVRNLGLFSEPVEHPLECPGDAEASGLGRHHAEELLDSIGNVGRIRRQTGGDGITQHQDTDAVVELPGKSLGQSFSGFSIAMESQQGFRFPGTRSCPPSRIVVRHENEQCLPVDVKRLHEELCACWPRRAHSLFGQSTAESGLGDRPLPGQVLAGVNNQGLPEGLLRLYEQQSALFARRAHSFQF